MHDLFDLPYAIVGATYDQRFIYEKSSKLSKLMARMGHKLNFLNAVPLTIICQHQ